MTLAALPSFRRAGLLRGLCQNVLLISPFGRGRQHHSSDGVFLFLVRAIIGILEDEGSVDEIKQETSLDKGIQGKEAKKCYQPYTKHRLTGQ